MLSFIKYIIPPSSAQCADEDILPDDLALPNDPALASRVFIRRFVCECFNDIDYINYYTNYIVEMSDERAIQMGHLLLELLENNASPKEFALLFFKELRTIR